MFALSQNIKFIVKYIIFRRWNKLTPEMFEFIEKSGVTFTKFQWKLYYYVKGLK